MLLIVVLEVPSALRAWQRGTFCAERLGAGLPHGLGYYGKVRGVKEVDLLVREICACTIIICKHFFYKFFSFSICILDSSNSSSSDNEFIKLL